MIEFKVNVEENLPYDRKSYLSLFNWYGVSFQLPGVFEGESVSLNIYKSAYEQWFKNLISIYDNGLPWIINHDFTDEAWFPNNEHNLLSLRKVFKKNNISNTFVGALVLAKEDLLELTEDIITYPFSVFNKNSILYDNLDISHSEFDFVVKISAHMCIDVLSTDKELLKKVVYENNSLGVFKVIEYQNTLL